MMILRIVLAIPLLILFVWCAGFNASILWRAFVRRRKAPSWIPFIGGLSGALALLLVPVPGARSWWWLPLLLDWGTAGFILLVVSSLVWSVVGRGKGESAV